MSYAARSRPATLWFARDLFVCGAVVETVEKLTAKAEEQIKAIRILRSSTFASARPLGQILRISDHLEKVPRARNLEL